MIVTFDEVINEVIRGLGLDPESVETRVRDSIKLRINEGQDVIFLNEAWEWRKRTFYFTTRTPYSTGTISVTQNSRTITGSGTTWINAMKMGYILINSKLYKISEIISATSAKLASPFDGATVSGLSYQIVFPEYPINHQIESVLSVKIQNTDLDAVNKNNLGHNPTGLGNPTQCALSNRTNEDYYNTGNVSVTNNSTTVTGTGTTWTSEMEGMSFLVKEFSKFYTIKTVNSTTNITLEEAYDGTTGAGKSYAVSPKGTQLMTFRSIPNDYYVVEVEALINPVKLVNGNDISLIPNHTPLITAAIWLALVDLEAKNPIRIQQAKADFEKTLKQLKATYRVISNVKWNKPVSKAYNGFNPLER